MRILLFLAVLALTVYSVIDCVGGEEERRKGIPTWLWVTLIIALPVLGAIIWLAVSRSPGASGRPARPQRTQPLAPDDDAAFLADLDRRTKPKPPADAPEDEDDESNGSENGSENGSSGGHKPE
ncbi:PLD nuclease N-terminal domain-containing protein [Ruania alba]|uniref:Phospholipase_D-nuclease N-terminal n=1 Tax=Ruania alba TaxID=648782 RepID=A0A1H5BTY9_9MICO|nr:PLD nuclease N-terminal domain-containing protein [Ruania alba]SED57671.1 Phospholipase_D-nuclease N-terminal [Ruania alba]